VEQTPDAIAVVYEAESLTYAELNRGANRLAHYLRRFVSGAEIRVALCVERSLELVIGLLATLKAGGAYVPLDPGYPDERMRQVLEDSQASVALTQQRLRSRLPEDRAKVIEVDAEKRNWAGESDLSPCVEVCRRNLAYVIYTSGSTGRPKGVCIEHGQLLSYVRAVSERLKLEQGWRMALASTFAADLGYTMLYPSLCIGGVLHVLSEERGRDPRLWEQYQSQRQIDCLKITPTQIRGLVEDGAGLPVKRLVLGGESCSREWVRQAREWSPGCEVVNHYGPTECTVGAVTHWVKDEEKGAVPIGKPLSNAKTYVLGGRGELTPIAVAGELYIGGEGVGRGYLNQAGQTAERFVPDEYSGGSGRRVYRTGDLVRRRADGNIEFLGRIDHQVKIRGYRIELGEIESVLKQHAEVREAVVVAEENEPGANRLVAYVVAKSDAVAKSEDLRRYLRARLPDYMLPSAWVMIDQLPLMPNGKVDRRVLRMPEASKIEGTIEYVPPQTPTEQVVAGIWANLLALDLVGRRDNFFSLGGHSMLAAQMIGRVRNALQIELPLGSLFEAPTVADFAEKIDAIRRIESAPSTPLFRPAPRGRTYPLSYEQLHLWLREQSMPDGSGAYISGVWRMEEAEFNLIPLEQSLTEIIRRHEALRTTFPVVEGEVVQLIGQAKSICLPVTDLSGLPERERESEMWRWTRSNARRAFDLATGPMIRARVIKLDERSQVFQYSIHHIIADAWSVAIIERELRQLYELYTNGVESPLEELPLQCVEYAVWQREHLTKDALQNHLEYWKRRLDGAPSLLKLPTDRPRPPFRTYRGAWRHLSLSARLTDRLSLLSAQENVTLFITMLAAFKALLYRYSGQQDISIGSPVTFRARAEIEGVIGYFTNIVILRTDLGDNPSFRRLVRRVREVAAGAYTHQDLPFGMLVDEICVDKGLNYAPLAQVWFNFLDHSSTAAPESIPEDTVETESNTNQFDLSMVINVYASGTDVAVGYNKDLFDPQTIKSLLGHFETIIKQVVINPDRRILDLSPLFDNESAHASDVARKAKSPTQ